MKKQQVLALVMAVAVTIQPQVVNAADISSPVEATIESSTETVLKNSEVTETADSEDTLEETTNALETADEAEAVDGVEDKTKTLDNAEFKTYAVDSVEANTVEGKLATVRVTNTDVYGIVGGKASLVGNYDQGQPAVPRDGVRWCLGDKTEIAADENKYGNPESTTMTLRNIEASQDGQQYCLSVRNAVGTAYSPLVTLHVLDASAKNQTVLSGSDATLTVERTGDWGYTKYQWYKGDTKIQGATQASYTVKGATSADAGEYKCVLIRGYSPRADEYNSKTVTAKLSIGKLATVRVTNTDVYGIVGGKASLVGNYDQGQPAVPRDGVKWCLGDKTEIAADENKYGNPESTTMTLRNIEASQDGQQYCLSVKNAVGTAYSPLVTLHVLDASAKNQTVLSGSDATLTVEQTGDWGHTKYQWYKGDTKIQGATQASYTVKGATSADAGEYKCVLIRGYSPRADEYNSKTVTAKLSIGKLATVRVTNTDVYGIVGGKASLVGNYDQGQPAVPRDGVKWCLGDKTEIAADENKYGNPESTTMTLRNIEASQDGQQYCLSVKNSLGTAYSPLVTLHVLDASAKNQTVLSGSDATLTVEQTGDWGYTKYQWYKGDTKIEGATQASYAVKEATSADAGEYKCVLIRGYSPRADEYNSKTVTAVLNVNERVLTAEITQDYEGKEVEVGTKVTFKTEIAGEWGTDITYQWYDKEGNALTDNATYAGTTTDTMTVNAAMELDNMEYYCVVSGKYGSVTTAVSTLQVKASDNNKDNQENINKDNTKKVEKATSKTAPKTADTAHTGLWISFAGLSFVGLLEALKKKIVK